VVLRLIARRLVHGLVAFAGITFVVFSLVHLAPGDPVQRHLGGLQARHASVELERQLRSEMGLDRPLLVQYFDWLRRAATLDFGRSFLDRRPVRQRITERVPATVALNASALIVALLIAIPVGLASAARRDGWFDRGSRFVLILLYAIPAFIGALFLHEIFAVRLGLFPLFGMRSAPSAGALDFGRHMILPVLALAYGQLALFARFTRGAVLESLGSEFVIAARARGLSGTEVVVRHGARSAIVPLASLLSVVVPYLLSGSVIVERIFRWDGLGNLFFEAVGARDYPTVMGLAIVTAVATLVASIAADVLCVAVDPRVREGEVSR
jgi:peptide/nickel transport system permease protein